MDKQKVDQFVETIRRIDNIPDRYSRADELSIFVRNAREFPQEVLEAAEIVGGNVGAYVRKEIMRPRFD